MEGAHNLTRSTEHGSLILSLTLDAAAYVDMISTVWAPGYHPQLESH